MKQMTLLESNFDTVLQANYSLYSVKLSALKQEVTSWYKGIDFKKFDERSVRYDSDEADAIEMKLAGLTCNFFFAYKADDRHYLMDGFNRLLTNYGKVDGESIVYLKVITSELKDHELMLAMYRLNMWKLYNSGFNYGGFRVGDFLDRGFRLLLHSKFGIDLYEPKSYSPEYEKRLRHESDVRVLDYYFIHETDSSDGHHTPFYGVKTLMKNVNIVNDFIAIVDGNNYLTPPFKNYSMFLRGFAMYLAYLRYDGNTTAYRFEFFLEKLYADKAFFKKLQGMSGTDSTRKNIYHFYRNLKLNPKRNEE